MSFSISVFCARTQLNVTSIEVFTFQYQQLAIVALSIQSKFVFVHDFPSKRLTLLCHINASSVSDFPLVIAALTCLVNMIFFSLRHWARVSRTRSASIDKATGMRNTSVTHWTRCSIEGRLVFLLNCSIIPGAPDNTPDWTCELLRLNENRLTFYATEKCENVVSYFEFSYIKLFFLHKKSWLSNSSTSFWDFLLSASIWILR